MNTYPISSASSCPRIPHAELFTNLMMLSAPATTIPSWLSSMRERRDSSLGPILSAAVASMSRRSIVESTVAIYLQSVRSLAGAQTQL